MSSWEDKLIAELERHGAGDPQGGQPGGDLIHRAFVEAVGAFSSAIDRVAQATGIAIETRGAVEEGRRRWSCGPRVLTLRLDPAAGRLVASADLGASLEIDELAVEGEALIDSRGRPASPAELAERFVPLLFRGR